MNWTKAIDTRIHAVWPESTAVMVLFELENCGSYVPSESSRWLRQDLICSARVTYEFVKTYMSPVVAA